MAKTLETNRDWRAFWNSVEQWADSTDLFKQVGRTVSGRAVGSGEVELVVNAVANRLNLSGRDCLLDLCCGNGLITERLASFCGAVVGVDYSEYLIGIAKQGNSAENVTYRIGSVENLEALDLGDHRPNKVSVNFGLQHFTLEMLDRLLANLSRKPEPVTDLIFTDVPDADRIFDFYDTPERREDFQRRREARTEAIGTWWDRGELTAIFDRHGYDATYPPPDARRLTNHYRFDVVARLRSAGR